jgi:hypothetical protein
MYIDMLHVCMCVYMYVSIHVHVYIQVCICIDVGTYIKICIYAYIYIHVYIYSITYERVYTRPNLNGLQRGFSVMATYKYIREGGEGGE